MITSQLDGEIIPGDYELHFSPEAGLLHPSKVRLAKVVTVEGKLVQKNWIKVRIQDWSRLKKEFKALSKLLVKVL